MTIRNMAAALLLALTLAGGASAASSISLPENGGLPGWERQGPLRRFSASNLYGHINGGAELFLELGFTELLIQPYRRGEREISLEVYRMESPLAALAVYLFKCGEETPWPEIGARNSSTRFQAVLLQGDCFVLVNSFSGDETLRPVIAGLARKLLEAIPAADPGDPFSTLPPEGRINGSQRLIRGAYSLQSLYTLGPGDLLQLGGKLFGVAADYCSVGETPITMIRVEYHDAGQAQQVFSRLQSQLDPALEPLEQDRERLVFRDFAGRYGLAVLNGPLIEIRVHLAAAPHQAAESLPAGQ